MLQMNLLGSMFLLTVSILTYSVRFDISVIAGLLACVNLLALITTAVTNANSYSHGYNTVRDIIRTHNLTTDEVEQMLRVHLDDLRLNAYGRGFVTSCYDYLERHSVTKEGKNEFFNSYSKSWGRNPN